MAAVPLRSQPPIEIPTDLPEAFAPQPPAVVLPFELRTPESAPEQVISDRLVLRSTTDIDPASLMADHPQREHHLYAHNHNGYWHGVRVSEPAGEDNGWDITLIPGFSEVIEHGTTHDTHNVLSWIIPNARLVSKANNGTGSTGQPIAKGEHAQHRFTDQADHMLGFLGQLSHGRRSLLVPTSLGSVISKHAVERNAADPQLNLGGVVHISPALVPSEHLNWAMKVRFPAKVVSDGMRNFFKHPSAAIRTLQEVKRSVHRTPLHEARTMVHQVREMLQAGIDPQDIANVLETGLPIGVITGEDDPVGQVDMYQELEHYYPNFQLLVVEGRGHELALDPIEVGQAFSQITRKMGIATAEIPVSIEGQLAKLRWELEESMTKAQDYELGEGRRLQYEVRAHQAWLGYFALVEQLED